MDHLRGLINLAYPNLPRGNMSQYESANRGAWNEIRSTFY